MNYMGEISSILDLPFESKVYVYPFYDEEKTMLCTFTEKGFFAEDYKTIDPFILEFVLTGNYLFKRVTNKEELLL